MENTKLKLITDALLQQMPMGVIISDEDGKIVYANQAIGEMRHVDQHEIIGKKLVNCCKPDSRSGVQRAMDLLLQNKGKHFNRLVEDKAHKQFFMDSYSRIEDDAGQTMGVSLFSEDVTQKRGLELARATAYRMLQESDENMRKRYHELLLASLETIMRVLEKRDSYTSDHSSHVCDYALKMYERRFGVGVDFETLRTAAILHDIGKIGIPDEILHKEGKLTEEEKEVIRQHSLIAEEILKPLDTGSNLSSVVRHHHEHFDGSGYPDGLKGEEIPMLSRIIAIADAYDAMLSTRPYRDAMSYQAAINEIITHIGKQFDPEWVKIFLDLANTGSI